MSAIHWAVHAIIHKMVCIYVCVYICQCVFVYMSVCVSICICMWSSEKSCMYIFVLQSLGKSFLFWQTKRHYLLSSILFPNIFTSFHFHKRVSFCYKFLSFVCLPLSYKYPNCWSKTKSPIDYCMFWQAFKSFILLFGGTLNDLKPLLRTV